MPPVRYKLSKDKSLINVTPIPELLSAAVQAAHQAGDILMDYLHDGVKMRSKDHDDAKAYDLVSDADIDAEQQIGNFLKLRFPDHALLGEETLRGDTDARDLWVIDPLDGTNNFAHGIPQFAVSIAYFHCGKPTVGVVVNPAHKQTYTATVGGGAFLNGNAIGVSPADTLSKSLVGCGFYYDRGVMMQQTLTAIQALFQHDIHGIRRFGAASLDLCHVAAGQFGGYFEYQLSPWDFAAGALIVQEAGGRVTDARGGPLDIKPTSVLASNGLLHKSLQSITEAHHP